MDEQRVELKKSVFGTATLGALLDALNAAPVAAHVRFAFCDVLPTTLSSYRGFYDHLALGWSGDGNAALRTARDLATDLAAADGKTFEGWKGGTYRMNRETPVWVDNPGRYSGTGIVAIEVDEMTVLLVTAPID